MKDDKYNGVTSDGMKARENVDYLANCELERGITLIILRIVAMNVERDAAVFAQIINERR